MAERDPAAGGRSASSRQSEMQRMAEETAYRNARSAYRCSRVPAGLVVLGGLLFGSLNTIAVAIVLRSLAGGSCGGHL